MGYGDYDDVVPEIESLVAACGDRGGERVADEEAKEIVRQAMGRFVTGNPRTWSIGLKPGFRFIDTDQLGRDIVDVYLRPFPDTVLFIPEVGADLPVFRIPKSDLVEFLSEGTHYEYYVLSPDLRQLLIETEGTDIVVADHRR